jgi:hypothetical protein
MRNNIGFGGVMKRLLIGFLMVACFGGLIEAGEIPISGDSEGCIDCHSIYHPGVVSGWKKSRHARITPGEAMAVKGLALKLSSKNVPDELKDSVVGCAECHTLRPEAHKDTFDHNGYDVHVVVSPKDCATCHADEAAQYDRNLMARAHENLVNNDVYKLLIQSINDTPVYDRGKLVMKPSNAATDMESCLYCHGTRLKVAGTETRETGEGEMAFPMIQGWPNQGTGRINLDDSRGSCSACHTRHQFSIEMARKPYTCKECHVGPDVPAFKVYAASKHGNIFSAHQKEWNFKPVPWTVGQDFTAPTCAACHISLLANTEGEVVIKRSHEVKDRLAYRIFGLIYAHPHPIDADTTKIRNKDGLALPTDFGGGYAEVYLRDEAGREGARKRIQSSCLSCHDQSWVRGHWERFENTIKETNLKTLTATRIMTEIWKGGYAQGLANGGSPFDEFIEKRWSDGWLFYSNSIRFASAMGGGGDYGVFAEGRYDFSKNIQQLKDWFESHRKTK